MKKIMAAVIALSFLMTGMAFAAEDKAKLEAARKACVKEAKEKKVPKDKVKEFLKDCVANKMK